MTPTNFSAAEYARRHSAIRTKMAERGLEALIVTAPAHLAYVAGDPHGFMSAGLTLGLSPLVLTFHQSVFLVRQYELTTASADTAVDEVVGYSADVEAARDPIDVLASTLSDLGLANARIGIEGDLWGLTPEDVAGLRRRLSAELVEASDIVRATATVKSADELAHMRAVARTSVAAVEAFYDAVEPGAPDSAVVAEVWRVLVEQGSGFPFYPPFVLSGARTWLPHGGWGGNPMAAGDTAFTELSASLLHYHSPLARTVVLGSNPEAEELYELARSAQDAAIARMRPGATTGDVDKACRDVLAEAGRASWLRHRVGYAVGIDWVGRKALSLCPGGQDVLEAGMTFHVVANLSAPERFGIFISDAVAVTDGEPEILSGFSRDLLRK